MRNAIRTSYTHTIYASHVGYITQAVVNNFAPLLFLTFASDYGLTLDQITLIPLKKAMLGILRIRGRK